MGDGNFVLNDSTPVLVVVWENADPMRMYGIYRVVKVIDTTWGESVEINRSVYNDPSTAGRYQTFIFMKPVDLGFFDMLGKAENTTGKYFGVDATGREFRVGDRVAHHNNPGEDFIGTVMEVGYDGCLVDFGEINGVGVHRIKFEGLEKL